MQIRDGVVVVFSTPNTGDRDRTDRHSPSLEGLRITRSPAMAHLT
jgi:hypothetical protein